MDTLFSIRKPYTNLIFDGTKFLEFRNRIGKKIDLGDTMYIYETKKNHGLGMVIGSVCIKNIKKIEYHKVGTYVMLPYYIEKYGNEDEKRVVRRAMSINLKDCDNSLVLNHLYNENILDYMEKHFEAPDTWTWELNQIPGLFNGYSAEEFNKKHKQSDELCKACDDWLERIGYYSDCGASYWKYAIELDSPIRYSDPKDIKEFVCKNGNQLMRAPQSWCYVE